MDTIKTMDAALLKKAFLAGAASLDAKKEWINDLNVFPVPDGDTGTNMTMTITSAAKEVSALSDVTMESLAKAISSGSLRGARGNSGVILSQLFRGFTKVIKESETIDTVILTQAFQKAVETAYKAVMKPKEGTILTVARGMADKSLELLEESDGDLIQFCQALVDEGNAVLEKTPDMLPVLKQAGVVDSGGQGLMVVLQGALDAIMGKEIDYSQFAGESAGQTVTKISAQTEEEIKFGYCTEYIIVLKNPMSDDEVLKYKAFLESIGDSIVVVADDEIVKTHVHTNDPGLAMQEALKHGSLSKIKVDNMREEHEERLIKNASELASSEAQVINENSAVEEAPAEHKDMGFVCVSVGDGLTAIFKDLGVDEMIEGGQTMNPSTEDIINAINKVNADNIFVLPNNKNIILAANQAQALVEDKKVYVIPTKTIPQGITALINFIPDSSADDNFERMSEEIQNVKSGQITYAVRDTVIDDKEIKENDYMGLGDNGLLAVGQDMDTVLTDTIDAMVDDDSSVVSIYYGADITDEKVAEIESLLTDKYPDLELEINAGGQPVYYYMLSVE